MILVFYSFKIQIINIFHMILPSKCKIHRFLIPWKLISLQNKENIFTCRCIINSISKGLFDNQNEKIFFKMIFFQHIYARNVRSQLDTIQAYKHKDLFLYIIKSYKAMNSQYQDPFIIIRTDQNSEQFDDLPQIKYRKPTKHTWTPLQSFIYVSFLKKNIEAMESKENRKQLKVFSMMAKIIKTRTSTQVKSHHQKLERKYGKIKTIISKVQQLLSKITMPSFKDAETSVQPKAQHVAEKDEIDIYLYLSEDVAPQGQQRSYAEEYFFQEESQMYLVFEGCHRNYDDEPLI